METSMTANYMSVVGGGWSVKKVDLTKLPGKIVAINDAAIHLPRCDYVVTMDRLWTEYRWTEIKKLDKPTWVRRSALKKVWEGDGELWKNLIPFENDNGKSGKFSENPAELNGNNSGACGLNLAYHLKPDHVWVFGLDMSRKGKDVYWYPPYPWNPTGATKDGHYENWAKLLEHMVQQLRARGTHVTVVTDYKWSKSVPMTTTDEFREFQNA